MNIDDLTMHVEIGQVLARYCHAVDHGDLDVALSVYWPDAVDHHGNAWNGNGQDYMSDMIGRFTEITQSEPGRMACLHHITSTVINRIGPRDARVEAYFAAYMPLRVDGQDQMALMLGRYLDHFQQRGDEWRVLERTVVSDVTRGEVGTGTFAMGSWQTGGFPAGAFGDTDPGVVFLRAAESPTQLAS